MIADLAAALRLQELDEQARKLNLEIASLPKHITEIEKKLVVHARKLDVDRAALAGNQKERKRLEAEIQVQEQKIAKLRDQMDGAKTNEVFQAFQHEIGFCQKEIRKNEDRILALMEESEPLERNVKAAEKALDEEKAQVEREKQDARQRTEADKKDLATIHGTRAEIVKAMTPPVYQTYERIRVKKGAAVAQVIDGRCTVCQMSLRPQYFQDLKRGESVLTCECCTRILIYNPPQTVEEITGNPA